MIAYVRAALVVFCSDRAGMCVVTYMDFLLINAGMASRQFSDILLSVLSDKFNASLALINIINENETAV